MKAKAVFLDRDGVINEYPGDFQYVTSWEQFRFLPNVAASLKRLADAGYILFVISNQAGVSKGIFSQEALDTITANMLAGLSSQGVPIRRVYYCTHLPEAQCACRKPKTGMVEMAADELAINDLALDRGTSYFIGDTMRDIETGQGSRLKTILVFSGKEKPLRRQQWNHMPDFVATDLCEAVDIILKK